MVAVAEKEGFLETFVSSCIDTSGKINKVLNNAPERADNRPTAKNQDAAKSALVRVQLPLYKISPKQQLLILKLREERTVYKILP